MSIDLDIALRKLHQLQLEDGDLGALYWREIGQLLQDAAEYRERGLTAEQQPGIAELNRALVIALTNSSGNAQSFAFHLTAPLAAWSGQGFLDEGTAMAAISLLHQLHPDVKV